MGWTQFQPQAFYSFLLLRDSNVTFPDSRFGLRLKSSYSNTGWSIGAPCPLLLGLPLLMCALLPILLAKTFVAVAMWAGLELKKIFSKIKEKQKKKWCVFSHWSDSWCSSRNSHASAFEYWRIHIQAPHQTAQMLGLIVMLLPQQRSELKG